MRKLVLLLALGMLLNSVPVCGQGVPMSYLPFADAPEDITDLDIVVISPILDPAWPGLPPPGFTGQADPQVRIRWTVEREGGPQYPAWENMVAATGRHQQPIRGRDGDPKGDLYPVWRPGHYTTTTRAWRWVTYTSMTIPPITIRREESAGPVQRTVTIYDTTPPRIQVRLSQSYSDAAGTIDIKEDQQNGYDVIRGATIHQGVLIVQGDGFDGSLVRDMNPSGRNLLPMLMLNAGTNPPVDIGRAMAQSGIWPSACSRIPGNTAHGFHIFEDIPLAVEARTTDNYEDYGENHVYLYRLVIEEDDPPARRFGRSRPAAVEGDSEAMQLQAGFSGFTILEPFKEPNYPLRESAPDEREGPGGAGQKRYLLKIWARDIDYGAYQDGQPNVTWVTIPVYVHDITPVCQRTATESDVQGLTVKLFGRNIDESITIIEDPLDHQVTAAAPKTVRFLAKGGHLVNQDPFETDFLEEIIMPDGEIISITDFGNICADTGSGLKDALMLPEQTRLQIEVRALDNYSIDRVVNDQEGIPPDMPPFLHWRIDGMENLDIGALDCPTEVKFQFANYRLGHGFISHVSYRFRFVLESRDKAGNEYTYNFPIYIYDTRYIHQEIMQKAKPVKSDGEENEGSSGGEDSETGETEGP